MWTKRRRKIIVGISIAAFIVLAFVLYFLWRGTFTGFTRVSPPDSAGDLPGQFLYPKDLDWYVIDTAAFGIDTTGRNARETTDGINRALQWAKSRGYENIKFPPGAYLIQCVWGSRFKPPADGIVVPSGLTLDLGDSTFMMEPNDRPAYCIFAVVNASDVKILGGTLIGDLEKHVFVPSEDSPTHEWGFGICVSAGRNVLIQGVTIRNMTGDGIIAGGSYKPLADGGNISSDVKIYNCTISDCRRQGISIVGATLSKIAKNTIYNISGTDPQFGIDIEPVLDYSVEGLKIHDNAISGCAGGAISCNSGEGYQVYANQCRGSIIAVKCNNVDIYANIIESSLIRVYKEASAVNVRDNQLDLFSRLLIEK